VLYGLEFKNPRFRRINLNIDGSDATRRAIGAADDHPLSVPALTRQAIKRLQRTARPREQARVFVCR